MHRLKGQTSCVWTLPYKNDAKYFPEIINKIKDSITFSNQMASISQNQKAILRKTKYFRTKHHQNISKKNVKQSARKSIY